MVLIPHKAVGFLINDGYQSFKPSRQTRFNQDTLQDGSFVSKDLRLPQESAGHVLGLGLSRLPLVDILS